MNLGIDASAALKKERTGVEEYVLQLLKSFMKLPESKEHSFFLYVQSDLPFRSSLKYRQKLEELIGVKVPDNFKIVPLYLPRLWRQARLSLHILFNKPDVLFMTAHVLPRFSPKRSVVTVHGLEYEHYPQYYPDFAYEYLRSITLYSSAKASKIITPSESTKKDLVDFYKTNPKKIAVVHHGAEVGQNEKDCDAGFKYILYVGRMELKKNVQGLIDLFDRLKERYKIPHKLVLVGGDGFGASAIRKKIETSRHKNDIIIKGHVSGEEKIKLMSCADILALVSFYEGFGLPIIEAQKLGVPVLCSDNSSMAEIAGSGAVKADPNNISACEEEVLEALTNKNKRESIIASGHENAKRFDWELCAKETLKVILEA